MSLVFGQQKGVALQALRSAPERIRTSDLRFRESIKIRKRRVDRHGRIHYRLVPKLRRQVYRDRRGHKHIRWVRQYARKRVCAKGSGDRLPKEIWGARPASWLDYSASPRCEFQNKLEPYWNLELGLLPALPKRKTPPKRGFLPIAGAGFEPATFGL